MDPQIVVGLLVDRSGFPLHIACFEGNKAETQTLLPVVQAFQAQYQITDMVVVADAGMLSEANLSTIDQAGLRFIVGSRTTKAPHDLGKHFHWYGTAFSDGQIIDTTTCRRGKPDPERLKTRAEPVWDPAVHPDAWRAIRQYSRKRAVRDNSDPHPANQPGPGHHRGPHTSQESSLRHPLRTASPSRRGLPPTRT